MDVELKEHEAVDTPSDPIAAESKAPKPAPATKQPSARRANVKRKKPKRDAKEAKTGSAVRPYPRATLEDALCRMGSE